jgi:hypothetical protein
MPERQSVKLPDEGAPLTKDDSRRMMVRRAMFAGLSGTAAGTLGNPITARPKLG